MAALAPKEIKLTPDDVVQAVRAFDPDELADLRQRLQEHDLLAELIKSGDIQSAPPKASVPDQDEGIPEFWKLIDVEPLPEPPPPTPEGDQIALEAVEWISGRFPITDPQEARWLAESEEMALYNAFLYTEKED